MILKKHKTTSFIEKHAIQTNICSNLKAVFFSKDEASIKRSVQHISELFIKVYNLFFFIKFEFNRHSFIHLYANLGFE